jgi:hypothetical protein
MRGRQHSDDLLRSVAFAMREALSREILSSRAVDVMLLPAATAPAMWMRRAAAVVTLLFTSRQPAAPVVRTQEGRSRTPLPGSNCYPHYSDDKVRADKQSRLLHRWSIIYFWTGKSARYEGAPAASGFGQQAPRHLPPALDRTIWPSGPGHRRARPAANNQAAPAPGHQHTVSPCIPNPVSMARFPKSGP